MVQPQEQMVTWAGLWGTRGGNNCCNCPLGEWFQPLEFSAFESNKGRKAMQIPTSQSCCRRLTVWFKLCDLRVCQAVILLNKSNIAKIKKYLLSSCFFNIVCFQIPNSFLISRETSFSLKVLY